MHELLAAVQVATMGVADRWHKLCALRILVKFFDRDRAWYNVQIRQVKLTDR